MKREEKIQQAATERGGSVSAFLAGLGVGAALSLVLAPWPGVETRRRIANKCLTGVEAASGKVHQARLRMDDLMDESQRRVTAAVAAGREMFGITDSGIKRRRAVATGHPVSAAKLRTESLERSEPPPDKSDYR